MSILLNYYLIKKFNQEEDIMVFFYILAFRD